MARCRYRAQCVQETDGVAAEGKRKYRLKTGGEDQCGEFDVKGGEAQGVEGAGSVQRKPPTKKKLYQSFV